MAITTVIEPPPVEKPLEPETPDGPGVDDGAAVDALGRIADLCDSHAKIIVYSATGHSISECSKLVGITPHQVACIRGRYKDRIESLRQVQDLHLVRRAGQIVQIICELVHSRLSTLAGGVDNLSAGDLKTLASVAELVTRIGIAVSSRGIASPKASAFVPPAGRELAAALDKVLTPTGD